MTRKRLLWLILCLSVVLMFWLAAAFPSLKFVWTKAYIEARWGLVDTGSIVDYETEFGWDATNRFYAVPIANLNRIAVIDRIERLSCPIGDGRMFRTGHWIQEANQTIAYEVRDWSRYGLDISYQLNLSTWNVTVTTRGTCPTSGDGCYVVDPPAITTYSCMEF